MKVWKLCRRSHQGKYWSIYLGSFQREYALGQTTIPQEGDGPLAAFRTLEEAQAERLRWGVHDYTKTDCPMVYPTLFEAEAEPSEERGVWTQWANRWGESIRCGYSQELPFGTILCDSITLIKEAK